MCIWILAVLGTAAGLSMAAPAPTAPAFLKRPTVARAGDGLRIDFAVDRATDVTVCIENAQGEIVRHLAAGVLGTNAPPPLQPGALQQSIGWDGNGDDGQAVAGRPGLKVRVAIGMTVNYAGTAFSDSAGPNHVANVAGLACGPDGRVFALEEKSGWLYWTHGSAMHVFRRDGSYEQTVMPFDPRTPPEKLRETGAFTNSDGRLNPLIHNVSAFAIYPCLYRRQQMAMTPEGRLVMLAAPAQASPTSIQHGGHGRGVVAHLTTVDSRDGSPGPAGPPLQAGFGVDWVTGGNVALSSDGRSVFLTGIGPIGGDPDAGNTARNCAAVFKAPLATLGPAAVFYGKPMTPGTDGASLSNPQGLAVDSKGHLLIADHGNNRVVVLNESDGGFAGSFDVPSPGWLAVHPKTGAVYVHSARMQKLPNGKFYDVNDSVIKFTDWQRPVESARLALPRQGRAHPQFHWFFALDALADPPVLWIGNCAPEGYADRQPLRLCEDKGDSFTALRPAGCYTSPSQRYLSADPLRREVGCEVDRAFMVLDEQSGKMERAAGVRAYCAPRLGPDGLVYEKSALWSDGVRRYDRKSGKLIPFPKTDPKDETLYVGSDHIKRKLPPEIFKRRVDGVELDTMGEGITAFPHGFCIDRRGNIYVRDRDFTGVTGFPGRNFNIKDPACVKVFTPDGRLMKRVLWMVSGRSMVGPRVDASGNLYVADGIWPSGQTKYPAEFAPRLLYDSMKQWYGFIYGSIVKYSPEGGSVWPAYRDGDGPWQSGKVMSEAGVAASLKAEPVNTPHGPGLLQGAKWLSPDFGCLGDWDSQMFCHCTPTEFDVDDFGRVFYPDQGRFRVVVRDTGGNEILHFGSYGNQNYCGTDSYVMDSEGKFLRPRRPSDPKDLASPFASPAIAFHWIVGLAVTDRSVYVADRFNRRVLRIKLDYAATERVSVPWIPVQN